MPKQINGLNEAKTIARKHNGKCLSISYLNVKTKMYWECKEGHRWYARLDNIHNGNQWCKKCADRKRGQDNKLDGLNIAQKISHKHGGRCLSAEYIDINKKMIWECHKKHIWKTSLNSIKNGHTWCQKCAFLTSAGKQNFSYKLKHWNSNEELICVGSYEKSVVEYLNKNKINFRWQHKTFTMPNGKTYRPDLYLFGRRIWIEIKGYFRDDAKKKWDWFHKKHKNSELWNYNKLKEIGII